MVFKGAHCCEEFVSEVTSRKYRDYTFFAHNLEFDASKIFEPVYGNLLDSKKVDIVLGASGFIKMDITIENDKKIHFRDTFNLVAKKLSKIGESLDFPKGITPQKFITGETIEESDISADDISYCKQDCKIILKLLDAISVLFAPFHIKLRPTIAANAKLIWKSMYLKDKGIFVNDDKDEEFREAYYGGRTEVFIRRPEVKTLLHYDVNSLYPSVMQNNTFPDPDRLSYHKDLFGALDKRHEGVVSCTVQIPDMNYPPLPYRLNELLIFPTGTFKGKWCFPEIRHLLSVGGKILHIEYVLSSPPIDSPYNEYVEHFSQLKIQYKKQGNKIFTALCKILLNSLYGKFGQRNRVEDIYVKDMPDKGVAFTPMGKNSYRLNQVPKERGHETVVCWAAYVTSYARVKIMSYFPDEGLRYCDTDSTFSETELPDVLVDDFEFGLMCLEDTVQKSFFVAPKRYVYVDDDNIVRRLKGVPQKEADKIAYEDYGNDQTLTYDKPVKTKTAIRKNVKVYSKEVVTKSLRTQDNKRIFDEFGNSKPIKLNL